MGVPFHWKAAIEGGDTETTTISPLLEGQVSCPILAEEYFVIDL